jgi:hypothetical protein
MVVFGSDWDSISSILFNCWQVYGRNNFHMGILKTGASKTGEPVLRPLKNTKKRHFTYRDMLTPYIISCRMMCSLSPMAIAFKSYH